MATESADKTKKDRSPSYPGIPLEQAIEKARTLYEKERKNSVAVETLLLKHWGYKSVTTGPATVALAALKKFGLIMDEGSGKTRRVRLTPRALTILLNPDDQARRAAVIDAALTPPIHAELWKLYGGDLPSDDSLHYELVVNRNFTETGARAFIGQLRATAVYAGLDSSVTVDEDWDTDEEVGEDADETADEQANHLAQPRRLRKPKAGMKTYAIPVDSDHDAVVELPVPMTTARWNNFKTFLTAMEAVIVDDSTPQDDED